MLTKRHGTNYAFKYWLEASDVEKISKTHILRNSEVPSNKIQVPQGGQMEEIHCRAGTVMFKMLRMKKSSFRAWRHDFSFSFLEPTPLHEL